MAFVLATVVQAVAIAEFYAGALRSLIFGRVIEMDMLVVISITAAYGYSVVAFGLRHSGLELEQGEFFETSTLLITLVLIGRLISVAARVRAISSVTMKSPQAAKALLVDASVDASELDARLLQFGDQIVIPPHSRVVTDGEILRGSSAVDELMLTGESVPVSKGRGDHVIAGTVNGFGQLTLHLTRLPGRNSISDIANFVERALGG